MFNYRILIALSIVLSVTTNITHGQLTQTQRQKIDSLVAKWNVPDTPGGVIGIMQQGEIVYTKGFGMASLEYDVPNTSHTLFNIGSVSKQFTAMGIVKLHLEGKLLVDDDIRKYIPDLPDFGHVITIRHLLHHTSGLRDIHSILSLAGWREDDPRSNDDLLRIIKEQHDLNFTPGDEYMYSNTGYIFMAIIIEKVTGEKFEDWMKRNIFVPFGMSDTYVESNATRVVKGNATSYRKIKNNNYARAVEYWNYTGSGNVHTTTKDLLGWLNNFNNPPKEWKPAFEMLQTIDSLNNGTINKYAFGLTVDDYKGEKRIQHGGAVGAFRAYASAYPNKKLCMVVLTNYATSQPEQKANLLSDIMMPELLVNKSSETKTADYTSVSNTNLAKYVADFWNDNENYARKIYVKHDTLWYFRSEGNESPLQYIGNDAFYMLNTESRLKVTFQFDGNTIKVMQVGDGESPNIFKPFVPVNISSGYLTQFTGKFNSPELKTYYTVSLKNDTLVGFHPRHGYFPINVLKQDLFSCEGTLGTIRYIRDASNKITGMRVSFDRVKNLWLEKVID